MPKKPKSDAYNLRDIDQAIAEAHLLPPARKIVSRRGGPDKFQVSSRKNKAHMPQLSRLTLEGLYELGAFYWLEASPEVLWYKPQPFKIRFHDGYSITTYISDFLAMMADGSFTLFEVKKSSNLQDPKVTTRLKRLKSIFSKTSVSFEVLSSADLNAQPKFDTLASLYGRTSSAITDKKALNIAKTELTSSLRHLGGTAKWSQLRKVSPLVNETGLALAIFDGLVTSNYRLPLCEGFEISFTTAGEEQRLR